MNRKNRKASSTKCMKDLLLVPKPLHGKKSSKSTIPLFIFLSLLLFASCEKNEVQPEEDEGYFPLKNNMSWEYKVEHHSDHGVYATDSIKINFVGEYTSETKSYHLLEKFGWDDKGLGIHRGIRREGGKYYEVIYPDKEKKILDVNLPEGSRWFYEEDSSKWINGSKRKVEYVVAAKKPVITINEKQYHDIIEIHANQWFFTKKDGWKIGLTTKHIYAKGVGEVYTCYSYNIYGVFNYRHYFLINHHK